MRYTLKSSLVLIAIVATGFWVVEAQTRQWREKRRIRHEIASFGGSLVSFDDANNVTWISIRDRLLGPGIARFDKLDHLDCAHSNITNDDLCYLDGLPVVMALHLNDTRISDAGLSHLSRIGAITMLRLNRTSVSDEGMDALAATNITKGVDLSETDVTVKGVEYLQSKRPDIWIVQREIGIWGDDKSAEP